MHRIIACEDHLHTENGGGYWAVYLGVRQQDLIRLEANL